MFINQEAYATATKAPVSSGQEKSKIFYNTLVISDTHLGKGAASAEVLLEFLKNVSCNRLILAGDILEGWGMKSKKRKPFPEAHARCLDAINSFAANGVEVIYLRGNHDEDLAKSRYKLMRRTIDFHDKAGEIHAPITFGKSFIHTDALGKNHLVLHGDVFDSFQKEEGKKRIAKLADRAYEGFVTFNGIFKKAVMSATGIDVSPASYLKSATKEVVGVIDSFERSVTKDSITRRFDGVICGHIHHAEIRQIGSCAYMNSGDWVEGCRCLAEKPNGEWEIVDWASKRKELGLTTLPKITDENPYAAYRPITERQLALVRRVWPGTDYSSLLAERRTHREKIDGLQEKILHHFESASNDDIDMRKVNKKIAKHEKDMADIKIRLQPHPI